jgi:peptidoglycan/xylan/chitin deacetylase (PgdA/CDA1 family)
VRTVRIALSIGLTLLLLAMAGFASYAFVWRQERITIRVDGVERDVAAGATLAQAARELGLQPRAGDLLDVQGDVLRPAVYPGHLLLDGRRAAAGTRLGSGDSLQAIDGKDRHEPSSIFYVRVPSGMPANPQFTLARTPGEQELERGGLSGKIVPLAFHPTGPMRAPKAVALTFDDGPWQYTPRILRVLERMHARATFFVVGRLAKAHPELVRREYAAGMEVGSHSYSHPYQPPFDRLPHPRILREIRWGRAVLADLGRAPTLFRPPGGSFSPYVIEAVGSYGERIVLWSVDPTDWKPGITAAQIVRRVLGAVRPGSIVILHDGGGDRSATVRALPRIIRGIRRKGLQLALIDPARLGPG